MPKRELIEQALTESIIIAFFEVYNTMRYGFVEHLYSLAMERELQWRHHVVGREISVPVNYKDQYLGTQRIDMLVDNKVVVEMKSTVVLPPTAKRQLYNYLRATDLEVGLLLHFGPEPKFYRVIATNKPLRPRFPLDQPDQLLQPDQFPKIADQAED